MAASELSFRLDAEDGWPPVAVEHIPCSMEEGHYRVVSPPLFVKEISVGDFISANLDDAGMVSAWKHLEKSNRTTMWVLRLAESDEISGLMKYLRSLGCHTVQLKQYGCYAVDIPGEVSMKNVDSWVGSLDSDKTAVVFPSFRYAEEQRWH
jgi:hypothetical protein